MAITQAQSDKDWKDYPDTSTTIYSTDLEALSRRSRDYRWMLPSGQVSIDEFDDDTLDAAWVRADGTGATSANATWTEGGDSLSVYNAGADASQGIHGLMRPLSGAGGSIIAGDAFITAVRFFVPGSNFSMAGIVLADGNTHGAGQQALGMAYATQNLTCTINGWGGSNFNAYTVGSTDLVTQTAEFFFRIVCITANTTWRVDGSPDGVAWVKGANFTKAVTPTHVGLLSSCWGSLTKSVVTYEFLRRVSGVS